MAFRINFYLHLGFFSNKHQWNYSNVVISRPLKFYFPEGITPMEMFFEGLLCGLSAEKKATNKHISFPT